MALQPIQGVTERWKEDGDGDMALVIAPGATVAVYNEATGALAPLFAERDGLSGLPNPFASDEYGRFSCYTATARVKIVVTTAAGEIGLFRNVPLPQLDLEGEFTPVVVGSSAAGSATYTVQRGVYKRIGDTVFFYLRVNYSGHTGTGNLQIQGLPFATLDPGGSSPTYQFSVEAGNLTFSGSLAALCGVSSTTVLLEQFSSAAAIASVAMDAAADIRISGHYPTGDA